MLKIAFIHPDLGIGGAERLVVDAALGLQDFGHKVDIYTSHHDTNHCFEETKDGVLAREFHSELVHNVVPPFPRAINGKFHILLAHLRQLHLTTYLLSPGAPRYDVFFVDQLSTCIPLLRSIGHARVVFYCHFPDKLLANGEFIEDPVVRAERNLLKGGLLKRIYRYPMDWLEEFTTRMVVIDRPTLISLNRFEKKKNVALAVEAFARIRTQDPSTSNLRLVLGGTFIAIMGFDDPYIYAGGYDPRLEDNMLTLYSLIDLVSKKHTLTYNVITPSSSPKAVKIPPLNTTPENPAVLFLLNFTTAQRTALLTSPSTIGLLYTPANEHFGIVPVEGMLCGVPVLACDSGGPVESIVDKPVDERTGWLRAPDPEIWAEALREIVGMGEEDRVKMRVRAKKRARELFGMEAMARGIEDALKEAVGMGKVRSRLTFWLLVTLGIVGVVLALIWV
ncbi:hypothetical protein HHX47_DHR6000727 [Lentinula edodes]|nr:hypothetical protein HHX47_DHR6000727 [Lentinula edodes]